VGVPEALLSRAGPLNTEEMDVVRSHAMVGARLLESLGEPATLIRHHHERLDELNRIGDKIGASFFEHFRYRPPASEVAAWRNSRRLLLAWLGTFTVLSVGGLWDFWRWEYNYGHQLDMETAILIIPGMSYQPPLIGSKQLLNFTAIAWPGGAAIALGLGFVVAALIWWTSRPRRATA
jgi:hypothetical protein